MAVMIYRRIRIADWCKCDILDILWRIDTDARIVEAYAQHTLYKVVDAIACTDNTIS